MLLQTVTTYTMYMIWRLMIAACCGGWHSGGAYLTNHYKVIQDVLHYWLSCARQDVGQGKLTHQSKTLHYAVTF